MLINASTQLFFYREAHAMVTWGKINFIFKTTKELFIHVDDKRNYWGIIHTCIWQAGRHFSW